ncbi:hypothetical protein ABZ897_04145 [Nonomuraea sp. NPDC046802]|uniref:hypothetical protein n=1 Tax=Nonomuraea sp. NPDC046802 TaxID=3154919 RepID=UPI0033C09435
MPALGLSRAQPQVGSYRAWEQSGRAPAYWFGHGLGYTTWSYDSIAAEGITVSVATNTGLARDARSCSSTSPTGLAGGWPTPACRSP